VAAIRNATANCVDEKGCTFERATLCAFDTAENNMDAKVVFLECMDEAPATKALVNAKECAAKTSPPIDFATVESCYNSDKGLALMEAQSAIWNAKYPKPSGIPAVRVNDVPVSSASYAPIKAAMCAAGSTSAVCK
jgi:hypothetical protein